MTSPGNKLIGKRNKGKAMMKKVIKKITTGLYNIFENIPKVT
jgi:hypothetical protein